MSDPALIDDFSSPAKASNGQRWRFFSDQVMGGVSRGSAQYQSVDGRNALRLQGDVSLDNNGGFIQASLDLASEGTFDAGQYEGVRLVVRGRGESYNLHLKTADVQRPWQSYRSSFRSALEWREIQLPFSGFAPYRINGPVDTHKLRRIGIVAIGAEFTAELCVAEIGFY